MKCMLCEKVTPADAEGICSSGNWLIERKFDGVRAYIEDGKLFDRRNVDITHRFPEFHPIPKGVMLDGEIVASTGEFADVSGRMHLKDKRHIAALAKHQPASFVAWDAPDAGGMLVDRRKAMLSVVQSASQTWLKASDVFPDFASGWEAVEAGGWEGLIIKRKSSAYEGRRSKEWLKVKRFVET